MGPDVRSALRLQGCSRLDLLLVGAGLALLVGAALPLRSRLVTHGARGETRATLDRLGESAVAYLRETNAVPASIADLLEPRDRRGGSGSPGPGAARGPARARARRGVDAWQRELRLVRRGHTLCLTSAGEDGEFGSRDDLSLELSVPWLRREKTLEQLRVLNRAIVLYNGEHQVRDPLPADWGPALDRLVARGCLPSAAPYRLDGWGDEFVADPPRSTPVVRVRSVNVSAGDASSERGERTRTW